MAETLSLELTRVVTIDTALLSTLIAKQGRVGPFPSAYFPFLISLPIAYIYLVYIYLISNRFMTFQAVSSPFIL